MNHLQLKTAIADWIKHTGMAATIPTLIQLAEARLARDLRVRSMLQFGTLTASGSTVSLPADFLEFKSLVYQDNAKPLSTGTVEQVLMERSRVAADRPVYAVVSGAELLLGPAPSEAFVINSAYYAKPAALDGDADTNWLLTNHPGLYLWASLAEAEPFMMNDARVGIWEGKYAAEKQALTDADKASEYSATGLSINQSQSQQVV